MKTFKVIFGILLILAGLLAIYLFLLAWGMGGMADANKAAPTWGEPRSIFEIFWPWSGILLGIALIYIGIKTIRSK